MSALKPPQPLPDPDTDGFWSATAAGQVALCRCADDDCARFMHPPLERCRYCGAPTTFQPISGSGRVHSFIVMHRASVPGQPDEPHVIASVDLDDAPGIRLTGLVTATEAHEVAVGSPVLARVVPVPGGPYHQPEFELATTE